jgi:phosphoglycerate dehydrogenase-like enzyme
MTMNDRVVLFAEEDTMFRLMETALNGEPSPKALESLRYFFGDNIESQLEYLVSIPSLVGLPSGFQGIVCEDEHSLPSLIHEADYLVCERAQIGSDLMVKGRDRLKLIQKLGTDYKNIDVNASKSLGIPVAYMRRIGSMSVGEHVMTLILALSRNLIFAHETAKKRKYATDGLRSAGPPRTKFNWGRVAGIQLVQGKKLGFVGFGENATEVAMLAHRFGMQIVYYQRHRAAEKREKMFDAQYMPSLEQLVAEADFVSIHVPYGPPTEKMFNRKVLANMKPTAFLINISRGGVIDEDALFETLSEKKIAGAALDVYRWEPVPSDAPLLDLDNILWTTHIAAGSGDSSLYGSRDIIANIARVARGETPEYLVK